MPLYRVDRRLRARRGDFAGFGQATAAAPIPPTTVLLGIGVAMIGLTVLGGALAEKHQRTSLANNRGRRRKRPRRNRRRRR
jgi:hypothetical protein